MSNALDWKRQAACRGVDTDLFFCEIGGQEDVKHVKRLCEDCPVRRPCLEYALRNNECFGVWGGMSVRERRTEARRRRLTRVA